VYFNINLKNFSKFNKKVRLLVSEQDIKCIYLWIKNCNNSAETIRQHDAKHSSTYLRTITSKDYKPHSS